MNCKDVLGKITLPKFQTLAKLITQPSPRPTLPLPAAHADEQSDGKTEEMARQVITLRKVIFSQILESICKGISWRMNFKIKKILFYSIIENQKKETLIKCERI